MAEWIDRVHACLTEIEETLSAVPDSDRSARWCQEPLRQMVGAMRAVIAAAPPADPQTNSSESTGGAGTGRDAIDQQYPDDDLTQPAVPYCIPADRLEALLQYIRVHGFDCDGCACGEVVFEIEPEIILTWSRGCHRSSVTRIGELWRLAESPEFYRYVPDYANRAGQRNFQLDAGQQRRLYAALRRRCLDDFGYDEKGR